MKNTIRSLRIDRAGHRTDVMFWRRDNNDITHFTYWSEYRYISRSSIVRLNKVLANCQPSVSMEESLTILEYDM